MTRPCLTCGAPTADTRCPEHATAAQTARHRFRGSPRARGYDRQWDLLSARARRLQPWCSWCGVTESLTTDHLPSAWARKAAGKPIRLRDVRVLCGTCNTNAGSSRPVDDQGTGALRRRSGPRAKAHNPSHTAWPGGDAA